MKAINKKYDTVPNNLEQMAWNIYSSTKMNKKTKENIQNSFLQLLREKLFMKESVLDITTIAAINRGTFYLHYEDRIIHLFHQGEENLLKGFELHFLASETRRFAFRSRKGTSFSTCG